MKRLSILSTCPVPAGLWCLGLGVRREGWGVGEPGSCPSKLTSLLIVPFSFSLSSPGPVPLSLFPLPSPSYYFSSWALSLWVSFDLCSSFSSFPLSLPDIYSPSHSYLHSPSSASTNVHAAHTLYILYCTFTVPFLCLNTFIYTSTIVLELPIVFSTVTYCTGL